MSDDSQVSIIKPRDAGKTVKATASLPFRVHFEDGEILHVSACDAIEARKKAIKRRKGIIRKIKRDRSDANG